MIWLAVALVAVVVAVAVGVHRSRNVSGATQFRRHIDALSPEARREVYERVQRTRPPGPPNGTDH